MIRVRLSGSTLTTHVRLALSALLLAAHVSAQAPTADLPPAEDPPELTAMQRQKLLRAVKQLRNSNATKRAEVEQDVIAFGRGAIPELMDAASTTHAGMLAGLQLCLVELVDTRDRLLVEDQLQAERVVLRRFGAQAVGKLGIPRQLDLLPDLLNDSDEDVATLAALSLAHNGREQGLGRLVDTWLLAREASETRAGEPTSSSRRSKRSSEPDPALRWKQPILDAITGLTDEGSHAGLVARLKIDPRMEQDDPAGAAAVRLAAIELLHHLGDEAAVRGIARALEDHHNLVQRAAINALRDLVEQQPPFQGATFQQIRELERLRDVVQAWRGFEHEPDEG
ncbi:MAG: hypothetical protein DRQ55_00455 [Planctomycetota bacterium]|nr:MAG: hypothetical protein DRQ55_00455 [Planctomycetota bacterium]